MGCYVVIDAFFYRRIKLELRKSVRALPFVSDILFTWRVKLFSIVTFPTSHMIIEPAPIIFDSIRKLRKTSWALFLSIKSSLHNRTCLGIIDFIPVNFLQLIYSREQFLCYSGLRLCLSFWVRIDSLIVSKAAKIRVQNHHNWFLESPEIFRIWFSKLPICCLIDQWSTFSTSFRISSATLLWWDNAGQTSQNSVHSFAGPENKL